MRRVTTILTVAAVVLMTAGLVAQAKPSFAGEWKIVANPASGGERSEPGKDLTITQSGTAMTVEHRAGGQAPAPVKLTYNLDGSVSKNMMAGGGSAPAEQLSKATWAADKLVVTSTRGAGEEKRTFSMEGDKLVVETSATTRNGGAPTVTRVTYQRYERGHGG